ncbi:MAG: ABC transporter ATP-binding protein [Synergistaceae bacterium]|jgi:ABC-2 type transport system ATP-binding protein|nr:ABC transporter ATP-binding protein [Synergistaceae bacterium]
MLEAVNLSKDYGKNLAVEDVTFTIKEGETVGLIGKNGAGKSTVMRMLTGYVAPSQGHVRVCGVDMASNHAAAARHIGYMPEFPPLYADLTVGEHLVYVASLRGIQGKPAREEMERVCNMVGILNVRSRLVKNLSKGYRQRVGFASAMVGSPKFMLLDEPTAGLDPRQIVEMRELIASMSGAVSFMISSHILPDIASTCSRILILHDGHVVEDGAPDEIARRHFDLGAVEVETSGSSNAARKILYDVVPDALVVEECLPGGVTRFKISGRVSRERTSEDGLEFRARIFEAFAHGGGCKTALVTLRQLEKSLEDIFIEITR